VTFSAVALPYYSLRHRVRDAIADARTPSEIIAADRFTRGTGDVATADSIDLAATHGLPGCVAGASFFAFRAVGRRAGIRRSTGVDYGHRRRPGDTLGMFATGSACDESRSGEQREEAQPSRC
jgi:hypothetical protein